MLLTLDANDAVKLKPFYGLPQVALENLNTNDNFLLIVTDIAYFTF